MRQKMTIKTRPTPATGASSACYTPLLFIIHMTAAWNSSATNTLHQTGISSGRLPGALGVSAESEWVQLRLGGNTRRRHLRVGLTDDGNKRAASEVGEQWLGDPCFMAVDCAPGLFAADDMYTQCEVTPFSAGESVCCKPFATPCDSDEACCSGLCSSQFTRCVQAIPSQSIASAETTPPTSSQTPDAFLATSATAGDSSFQPAPTPTPYDTAPSSAMTPNGTPSESPPTSSKQPPSAMPVTDTTDTSRDRQPSASAPGSVWSTVAPTAQVPSRQEKVGASSQPGSHQQGDNKQGRSGAASDSVEPSQCTLSYALGTITTVAASNARVQAVAIDSQGNVFYSLGSRTAVGGVDSIRRAADVSASTSNDDNGADDGGELVFVGTGAILALAVDADDNIIYSMADGLGQTGRVYTIPMTSGGIPVSISVPSSSSSRSATTNPATDTSTSSTSPYSFKGIKVGHAGDSSGTVAAGERKGEGGGEQEASGSSLADAGASLPLGKGDLDLGPFLPGIAVCPATGDVYVARGHAGLTRMMKSDGFDTQVHWGTADMVFTDGDKEGAPLMIWDVAVDGTGVVYLTTYVQGVMLKGVFPEDGGTPTVRLAAGTWDSGVSASSGDGKRATAARLAFPKGVSVGDGNTVYVSEFQGAKVRAVTSRGGISTAAGTGKKDYTGDGGRAKDATLDMPNAIAFALGGEGGPMAIADFGNNAVRVVTPSCL